MARQQLPPGSRFRVEYRPLDPGEKHLIETIKTKAAELEALIARTQGEPTGGRYNALALTALETSVMWAVKEISG